MPAQKVDTRTNALPEAIAYDIDDGSIELVYSCEYIPYVVNVPGAPDTEWHQLRGVWQADIFEPGTYNKLTSIPALHDPFVTGGAYDAQERWETYHRNCMTNFGVDTRPPLNSFGMVKRLQPSQKICQEGIFAPESYEHLRTDAYSSLPLFNAGYMWNFPGVAKISVPDIFDNTDLADILNHFGELHDSEHPMFAERLFTSTQAGLPLVLGRKTSAYARRISARKLTFDNIKSSQLRLKHGQNGDQMQLKLYGGLVGFMPNAYNLRTVPLSNATSTSAICGGSGVGRGKFGDCCDDHSDCSGSYVCHPVEHACTIQCNSSHSYTAQLISATLVCPEEPLTQLSLCQPLTKIVSKTSFVDNAEGAARLNTTARDSPEYVWLCRARKAVGNSFAPFCSACRGLSLHEHPLKEWNNGSITTSAKKGVAADWTGDTKLRTTQKKNVNIDAIFALFKKSVNVSNSIFESVEKFCNDFAGICSVLQDKIVGATQFDKQAPGTSASSAEISLISELAQIVAQLRVICQQGHGLISRASVLVSLCNKDTKETLLDAAQCLANVVVNTDDVDLATATVACVIDQVGDTSEDRAMKVALESGVFRPIVVDSSPANMFIMANPPSTVLLREVFILSVQVMIQSGAPLPGQLVTIHIGSNATTKYDPLQMFLQSSGSESPDIDSELVEPTLDASQTSAFTEADGIARFRLRFLSGLRGQYTLYAKAGAVTSPKSNVFQLENSIRQVQWVDSLEQSLTLVQPTNALIKSQDPGKVKFPVLKTLAVQPKIRILNKYGEPSPPDSDREVAVVLTRFVSNETNTLNQVSAMRERASSMSAWQRAQGIFQVLLQGARRLNFIPVNKPKATVVNADAYTQNSLGVFEWHDLSLDINEPTAQYRMIILVDGVSTPYSGIITVTVEEPTTAQSLLLYYIIKLCIFLTAGFMLIGNSTWHNPLLLLLSAIVCIVCIVLSAMNILSPPVATGDTDITKILMIVFLSAVLVWVVKITVVEVLTKRRGRVNPEDLLSVDDRGLRPRRRCRWCYNFADHRRHTYFRYVRRMFYSPSASRKVLVRPKGADPTAYDKYASQTVEAVFPPEEFVKSQGKCATLRSVFTAKDYDAFFFPQRVILSFFAAIFVLMMTFVQILAVFLGLKEAIHNAANVALETVLAGLASFVRFHHEKTGLDLFDLDGARVIDITLDDATYLHDQMENVANTFYVSYIVGFAVSMLVFFYSWIQLIVSFRAKVLDARRGVWSFNPAKVRLADAANFVGISISNGLMSFIYFAFIFTVLTFFVLWDLTVSLPQNLTFSVQKILIWVIRLRSGIEHKCNRRRHTHEPDAMWTWLL